MVFVLSLFHPDNSVHTQPASWSVRGTLGCARIAANRRPRRSVTPLTADHSPQATTRCIPLVVTSRNRAHIGSEAPTRPLGRGQRKPRVMKTDVQLIDAYHSATFDYQASKAGTGARFEAFTRLLVAERVLTTRLPGQHLVCWPHRRP